MAAFKRMCRGFKLKINDRDHLPPHCHVNNAIRNRKIRLLDLVIMNPPPDEIPARLSKCLKEYQEQMLEAWDSVSIYQPGDPR